MPRQHADLELIGTIERAMALNLRDYVDTYRRTNPHAGAARIEVAGGVVAFTGIGSPLTTVKAAGQRVSRGDLALIEEFFDAHRVDTVTIETAPWLDDESKQNLRDRDYRAAGEEDVVATVAGGSRSRHARRTEAVPIAAWPDVMRICYELEGGTREEELLAASGLLPGARLYGIRENGVWIACGQAITYDEVVIFGNDGTRPEARRRGAQTALIEDRLQTVRAGQIVAAEVAPRSGSERNYLRTGFEIAYTRTQYVRSLL